MSGLCKVDAVAEHLQITVEEVERLIEERMPYIDLFLDDGYVRFRLASVDEWIKKRVKRKKCSRRPTLNEMTFILFMAKKGLGLDYEPKVFKLQHTTYKPDFYCQEIDTWYEVSSAKNNYECSRPKVLELLELNPELEFYMVKPNGQTLNIHNPEFNNWAEEEELIQERGRVKGL